VPSDISLKKKKKKKKRPFSSTTLPRESVIALKGIRTIIEEGEEEE